MLCHPNQDGVAVPSNMRRPWLKRVSLCRENSWRHWWLKIRHITACPDVQIRDLRRSTASWLTMHGENLKVVQSILDHSSLSTTQIYARLDIGSIREALQRHARRLFPIRPKT